MGVCERTYKCVAVYVSVFGHVNTHGGVAWGACGMHAQCV
jgi:hypothetical protein